jgi:serine/threonine-protein kinase
MSQSQPSWLGRTIGGRYQIETLLGQGGMSSVFRATDPNLHRSVAVKLIHSHLSADPEFVRRFEQEAAAVAQLRHPNIIQVYDFDHDGDVYYMVLEHVPGETLQSRLRALSDFGQRLPLAETIRIMSTICDAVAYAHQRNMIHRDLKPANVMLNPIGQPILMDFGVAKMLGEAGHTATGDVIGTAQYMAPEQARGERPDERADIYSLGIMLFEMATGKRPFDANTAVSVMMKHLMEPVPDPRQFNRDMPSGLITVIEKALAKSPADRYQSAADMATALRAVSLEARAEPHPAAEQPVTPPTAVSTGTLAIGQPPTDVRPPAVRPVTDRRRLLIGGAVALVAIVVLGLVVIAPSLGGPALPGAEGMARIDGGVYLVGLDASDTDHAPPQQAKLNEFWIDQYEITNAEYARFVQATSSPPPASWADGQFPTGEDDYPVQGVTLSQAAAFCDWANKRLPTEAEWEVAARGPEDFLYPWGNDEHSVALPRGETYPVGSVAANRSRYGVFDMAGNVWEWVGETYTPVSDGAGVLRGGQFGFLKDMAYRLQGDPNLPTMYANAGVRCAAPKVSGDVARAPTPTAVQQLAEGVLFQDEFADPASGWPVGEEGNYTFGYHPQSFYHLQVSAPNDRLAISRYPNSTDFIVETDVLVDHTDTDSGDFRYGLALRRNGDQYYAFMISARTKTWQITKQASTGAQVLAEGANESIQDVTGVNTLRVDAVGSNFTFYIDGQVVKQVSDSDYASGEVGFVVETLDETLAHIHYAGLVIRQVEAASALFQDDFTDPNSGWPTQTDETSKYGYHPPAFYHLEVSAPNSDLTVFRGLAFDHFSAATDVLVDHTDTDSGDFRYGLVFRRNDDQYYAFTISPRTKTWQMIKQAAAGAQVLSEGAADTIQGLTQLDTLGVDANGSNFTLSINGQPVAQVSDADYAGGEIGLIVQTLDETLAHVHYKSLLIKPVEETEASATPEATPEPTATPIPVPDGMTLIPAGYFHLGSSLGEANEAPEHPVLLNAFYIDLYEVTNAQYRACVEAGGCAAARVRDSFTHRNYRDDAAYDNFPAIGVTWDQATAYCGWAGKRLPTEAEWEFAASGPEDRVWPWGNTFDANLSAASANDVQPVGSYPGGVSPFGVFDMAGNVTEWVADTYDRNYYANSPASNPFNEAGGNTRVFRGGSFDNANGAFFTTSRRFPNDRSFSDVDVGFRCAQDATEVNAAAPAEVHQALVTEFCQVYAAYKPDAECP